MAEPCRASEQLRGLSQAALPQGGGCPEAFPWFLEAAPCCSRVLVVLLQELTWCCTACLLAVLSRISALQRASSSLQRVITIKELLWRCWEHKFHLAAFSGLWHSQVLATWPWSSWGKQQEAPLHPKELLLCCCSAPLVLAPRVWANRNGCRSERQGGVLGFVPCWELFWLNVFPLCFQPDPVKLPLPVGLAAVACRAVPGPGLLRFCWGFWVKDPTSVPEEPQETLPLLTLCFLIHSSTPQRFYSLQAEVSALRWVQEGTSPCV